MRLLVKSQFLVLFLSYSVNAQSFNFGDLFNQIGNFGGQQGGSIKPSQSAQLGSNDNNSVNSGQTSGGSQKNVQATSSALEINSVVTTPTQAQSTSNDPFFILPIETPTTNPQSSIEQVSSTLDSTSNPVSSVTSISNLVSTTDPLPSVTTKSSTNYVSVSESTSAASSANVSSGSPITTPTNKPSSASSSVATPTTKSSSTPSTTTSTNLPTPTNGSEVYKAAVSILNSISTMINNSNISQSIKNATNDIIKNLATILLNYLK